MCHVSLSLLRHHAVLCLFSVRVFLQVLLRWGLQQGCAVIPKSVNPERIQQASPDQLLSWELSAGDLAALDALEDGTKFCWDASKIL
jgi:diketogulonate reductase-like aldo/keto reductase